jgi:hypothetical protein
MWWFLSAASDFRHLCILQSKLRKDAAAAQVEQQKKEKEAVQAANEATLAQLNEQHNLVRRLPSSDPQSVPQKSMLSHMFASGDVSA